LRFRVLFLLLFIPLLAPGQVQPDTIGATTYDWQASGPARRMLAFDSTRGIHAAWMFSAQAGPDYTDRNLRYNFRANAEPEWNWIDRVRPTNSGVSAFSLRTGFGSLDVDPQTGSAILTAHAGSIYPTCARDGAPGAGSFEERPGTPVCDGFLWPQIAAAPDGAVHCIMSDDATGTQLHYSRLQPWGTWSEPIQLGLPPPGYSSYFIEAAPLSRDVLVSWVNTNAADELYYRLSPDGGSNWNPVEAVPPPPAFSGGFDTVPVFHYSSNSLFWDDAGNWHLVVAVGAGISGQFHVQPAEIWHYCPTRTPPWSRVARAACDPAHLAAPVGYNALYAARPMLGTDARGNLYCVWEQFDSTNVEPATDLLRADILAAGSSDNGRSWTAPVRLTTPDNTSHRFPSLARNVGAELHILYEQDLQAGFRVMDQGVSTENPIVYLAVGRQTVLPSAVGERPSAETFCATLRIAPGLFSDFTRIELNLPRAVTGRLQVCDRTGRSVRTIAQGRLSTGTRAWTWSGRDDSGRELPAGVYIVRLVTRQGLIAGKAVLNR
jgi:hypothetical protein